MFFLAVHLDHGVNGLCFLGNSGSIHCVASPGMLFCYFVFIAWHTSTTEKIYFTAAILFQSDYVLEVPFIPQRTYKPKIIAVDNRSRPTAGSANQAMEALAAPVVPRTGMR